MEKKWSILTVTIIVVASFYALSIFFFMDFSFISDAFRKNVTNRVLQAEQNSPLPVDKSYSPLPVDKNYSPLPVDKNYSPLPVDKNYSSLLFKKNGTVSKKKKSSVSKSPKHEYLKVETPKSNSTIGLPVITRAQGGLGNQLFEFACAYSIARQRNANVYITAPPARVASKTHTHTKSGRDFSLNHFNIKLVYAENEKFKSGKIFDFKEQNIWEKTLPKDKVLRVADVCVSEVYFKEYRQEIKDMFVLDIDERPIMKILEKVANSESVGVHVRRGDYTNSYEKRTIPITFQKRAMKWIERMVPNATFFVFSDDLEYVRKEFKGYPNLYFVDNSSDKLATLYDFLIMSKCKHNVIANSTFSWWAAYLNANKNKIVIGPMPRHPPGFNDRMYKNKNFRKYRELVLNYYLYPPDWLTINPFEY